MKDILERLRNPFIIAFIISFSIIHWRPIVAFVYYDKNTFNLVFKTDIIHFLEMYFENAQKSSLNNTPVFIKWIFEWDWLLKMWVIFLKPSFWAFVSITIIPISKKCADYINLYFNNRTLRNRLNKEKSIHNMSLENVNTLMNKLKNYEILENNFYNTTLVNDTNLLGTWTVNDNTGNLLFTLIFEYNNSEIKWIDDNKNFIKQVVGFKFETMSSCSFFVIDDPTKVFNDQYIQFAFYMKKNSNEKYEGFYFDNTHGGTVTKNLVTLNKKL